MRQGERIDDLQREGLRIIQNPDWFCFGIDAVLLSDFIRIRPGKRAVEFGSGTGIIPILLTARTQVARIHSFEIQGEVADMARRSVQMNGLEERIEIVHGNLTEAPEYLGAGEIDVVFSNPPYMTADDGMSSPTQQKAISRHELTFSLEELFASASRLLKDRGDLFLVHRPHRLVDLLVAARAHDLEPKTLRFVHPKDGEAPNILLLHCKKRGRPELKFMPPLVVYNERGDYTEAIHEIYRSARIDTFEGR